MNRHDLTEFIRTRRFAVMASVSGEHAPQAALVNYAVTADLEFVFDTTSATRKWTNLRANPKIALVVGWEGSETVQIEGIADEPQGAERERLVALYLETFPESASHREWPGITWFRVRPRWIRHSSYYRPRSITEFSF